MHRLALQRPPDAPPWTPAAGSAPDPPYRLAFRARRGIQTLPNWLTWVVPDKGPLNVCRNKSVEPRILTLKTMLR